jgi:hypothetical protein
VSIAVPPELAARLTRCGTDAGLGGLSHTLWVSSETGYEQQRCQPLCPHCGEIIGVYEPLIVMAEFAQHETSITAEPHLFPTDDDCYHRRCYYLATRLPEDE